MYKVIIYEPVREQIRLFVQSILKKNLSIFEDTGIYNEELIQENYFLSAQIFHKNILQKIGEAANPEIIGNLKSEDGNYFTIRLKSFVMFIKYTQDISGKTRYIEDIEFFRK